MLKSRLWLPGGATAARMSCPGAIVSGFSRSPPPARSGPRDENAAVNGAGSENVMVALAIVAVAPGVAAYALTAGRSRCERCTVGTKWRSAFCEFRLVFTRIMPMPPASATARLLLVRAFTPRSHRTIFPATLAGSSTATPALSDFAKQSAAEAALAPGAAAAVASIRKAGPTAAAARDGPLYFALLPSVTLPRPLRLCVPAATVVIHGEGWATVDVAGPSLPAEAETKTPASAANRNAISAGSRKLVDVPLIEKLITSTPSATA